MFAYQLRLAFKSLRRNPVLSTLLVAAIGLGIAVSTASVTIYHIYSSNPIPHKSDVLFHVEIDNWHPDRPFDSDHPERAPFQITYRDAMAIMQSEIPTYQNAAFRAELMVFPDGDEQRPFREIMRMCSADFFMMFDVPFQYGGGWTDAADQAPEPVIVINSKTNQRLFGGSNSVGRSLKIEDRYFTIIGVLAPWRPSPKHYDPTVNPFGEPEAIFMPFSFTPVFEVTNSGNTWGWTSDPIDTYEDYLQSELLWIQMWVQLDTAEQKQTYQDFLDAYVLEQKKLDRLSRPLNNRLLDVMTTLEEREVVPDSTKSQLVVSLLFLVVCAINLIGILLGKFLSRAPEIGVRRALGASRRSVFTQHLIECEVIGVLGGSLGLAISVLILNVINRMLSNGEQLHLDLNMVGAGLLLSLVAGLIAGIYPSWRICHVAPAVYLKMQ
ncbi:ABC transporter permease [bacterium]|nr:ABC transporter permease [bacterium]